MKKITALILAVSMLMTAFGLFALADDSATVYVTISDGSVVLACQPVELSDVDGDKRVTIFDATLIQRYKAGIYEIG